MGALAFEHPGVQGGLVIPDGTPGTAGHLAERRTLSTMAGDLEELLTDAQVLGCFGGGEIRDTVCGHPDLRVGPWV